MTDIEQIDLNVVFGTGPVGLAVIRELVARGRVVRAVNRSGQATVPAGVELVAGDATDAAQVAEICAGAAIVYNCTNAPYDRWPELFPPLQAGILAGAIAAGAPRLVVIENVYMYGATGGRPLTEDLPHNAQTRKGRTRAAMAQALLAAHQSGQIQVVSGRASDFFGPGVRDSAMGERVIEPLLAGKKVQLLGNPNLPHTYTYIGDVGRALVMLGECEAAYGRAWHLPSQETVSTAAFVEMLAEEAGQTAIIQKTPKLLLKALGLFHPMIREIGEMLYEFEEPFIVDHTRFATTFGFEGTPLREAIRETMVWWQKAETGTDGTGVDKNDNVKSGPIFSAREML